MKSGVRSKWRVNDDLWEKHIEDSGVVDWLTAALGQIHIQQHGLREEEEQNELSYIVQPRQ